MAGDLTARPGKSYTGLQSPARNPLDEDEVSQVLAAHHDDTQSWLDYELSHDRAEMMRYYRGEPFGNEEEGRSQVVSCDVRDVIGAMMPELMRIFFGSERIAEFEPRGPEDTDAAQQATEYVDYIIRVDNEGYKIFYDAIKNSLIEKTGILKWWWEELEVVEGEQYTGLTLEELMMLMQAASQLPEVELDWDFEGPTYNKDGGEGGSGDEPEEQWDLAE